MFSKLLPDNKARKDANKLAKAVLELEKRIAAVTPPPEDQQDVTVSPSSIVANETKQADRTQKYYNIVKVADAGEIGPALRYDSVVKNLGKRHTGLRLPD